MIPALVGKKIGMTQVIVDRGVAEPATVVKVGPCVVLRVRTRESDGYDAVQLGFDDVKPHRSTKAMIGHAAKAGAGPKRYLREIRLSEPTDVEQGAVLTVELFQNGVSFVDVSGITKGKGFQGVMKRHGFGGQPASHGTERKHRSAGGIGGMSTRGTGRAVKKGKRMSGHMGTVRTTMSNLRLLSVDPAHDLLVIRGSIPGANGSYVTVRKAKKKR